MTDRECLLGLLKIFNIPEEELSQTESHITLSSGVNGYAGFKCRFDFTKEGKFISHCVYE